MCLCLGVYEVVQAVERTQATNYEWCYSAIYIFLQQIFARWLAVAIASALYSISNTFPSLRLESISVYWWRPGEQRAKSAHNAGHFCCRGCPPIVRYSHYICDENDFVFFPPFLVLLFPLAHPSVSACFSLNCICRSNFFCSFLSVFLSILLALAFTLILYPFCR